MRDFSDLFNWNCVCDEASLPAQRILSVPDKRSNLELFSHPKWVSWFAKPKIKASAYDGNPSESREREQRIVLRISNCESYKFDLKGILIPNRKSQSFIRV